MNGLKFCKKNTLSFDQSLKILWICIMNYHKNGHYSAPRWSSALSWFVVCLFVCCFLSTCTRCVLNSKRHYPSHQWLTRNPPRGGGGGGVSSMDSTGWCRIKAPPPPTHTHTHAYATVSHWGSKWLLSPLHNFIINKFEIIEVILFNRLRPYPHLLTPLLKCTCTFSPWTVNSLFSVNL